MKSFELSELIVRKGIKSQTELFAYAIEQKSAGKSHIAEFIVNQGPPMVSEVLAKAYTECINGGLMIILLYEC